MKNFDNIKMRGTTVKPTYMCVRPEAEETVDDLKYNNIKWLTVSRLG
jgi:hypothetical protein